MVVLSYGALVGIVIGSTVVGGAIAAWAIGLALRATNPSEY